MAAYRDRNILEVFLNFLDREYHQIDFEQDELDNIAYALGHGIAERVAYAKDKSAIIFFFDESRDYPEYENEYKFSVDGETIEVKSDFPLINYMQTEFDLEFVMFNEKRLKKGISDITKNGQPLFDIVHFMDQPSWGIIRIEKSSTGYIVALQDCNFFNTFKYNTRIMSYIGQYAKLEMFPTLDKKPGMNPFIEIYMSGDEKNFGATVERVRNYGLSPEDIRKSLPQVIEKIPVPSGVDWANYMVF
jgi:hypothetical protein